jgi:nucleotide-binding universal stress UspA family protein
LSVCKREGIELLLAGALRKENLVKFYIGSIARRILRKANCSVFTMIEPSAPPQAIKRVVINATEGVNSEETVKTGITWSKRVGARKVVIFKAIPLFGLSMAISGEEGSERSYEAARRKIISEAYEETEALVNQIDTGPLKIHIKIAAGKPGYELRKCALKIKADLLVVKAPGHKLGILDRLFPHYLEQVLWDLPCNLLIDKR